MDTRDIRVYVYSGYGSFNKAPKAYHKFKNLVKAVSTLKEVRERFKYHKHTQFILIEYKLKGSIKNSKIVKILDP